MSVESLEWYPWDGEHSLRTVVSVANGKIRVVCRCGFMTHWYSDLKLLHRAVDRHSQNVAMQNMPKKQKVS